MCTSITDTPKKYRNDSNSIHVRVESTVHVHTPTQLQVKDIFVYVQQLPMCIHVHERTIYKSSMKLPSLSLALST